MWYTFYLSDSNGNDHGSFEIDVPSLPAVGDNISLLSFYQENIENPPSWIRGIRGIKWEELRDIQGLTVTKSHFDDDLKGLRHSFYVKQWGDE